MQAAKNLTLVFGSTGATGYHAASLLLEQGFPVRIVVRSKAKAINMFGDRLQHFESVIEGELTDHRVLDQAFAASDRFGKVGYVVSALGANIKEKDRVQEIEYLTQVKIVEKCKQAQVIKYIFVSGALMERPWNMLVVFLNTLITDVYYWKARAENYIRRSGINYAIVRPTGLVGDHTLTTQTPYELGQGDRLNGRINRRVVGDIILDTIASQGIPEKVTFECTGATAQAGPKYDQLQPDSAKSIVTETHRTSKFVYWGTFLGGIAVGTFLVASRLLA